MTEYTAAPALPVSIATTAPVAQPALRVYRDDGLTTRGGPAIPVYIVSEAEAAQWGTRGNVPVPIVVVSDGRAVAGNVAPIPVYVVNP
jgi:hypothetical protein